MPTALEEIHKSMDHLKLSTMMLSGSGILSGSMTLFVPKREDSVDNVHKQGSHGDKESILHNESNHVNAESTRSILSHEKEGL